MVCIRVLLSTGSWPTESYEQKSCFLVQVVCGTMGLPTATVQMLGPDGITHVATGLGTGPVDAAYKAIDSLIRVPVRPHTSGIY